jgi:hypothetical protein
MRIRRGHHRLRPHPGASARPNPMALGAPVRLCLISALVVAGVSLALTSCSLATAPGAQLTGITCPAGRALVTMDELDLSGLSRSRGLLAQRLDVVESDAEHAAYCQGRFTVIAFSTSAAANVVLYDALLAPPGATQIARDRETPLLIKDVMVSVRTHVQGALRRLPSNGTDLAAAFTLATDDVALFGHRAAFNLTILSDGISTTGPASINTPNLNSAQAVAEADQAPPADLAGAHVVVEGVGTVAGSVQPPSDYVEAVRTYVNELCRRSRAASCLVTTEVTTP